MTIIFENVTANAGVNWKGERGAFATNWIDFNNDGLPDLWVSPHSYNSIRPENMPNLYLNQGDGTFSDIFFQIKTPGNDFVGDAHGSSWSDFDNDGDVDLFVAFGGGGGLGEGSSRFFINQGNTLEDWAVDLEVDLPLGRGRSALWFDWDKDGLLDLLEINAVRPDRKAPTTLFEQTTTGFRNVNAAAVLKIHQTAQSAQITDLFGNGTLDLLILGGENEIETFFKVYENETSTLTDLSSYFPSITNIQDAAVADFNGDLIADLFLIRSELKEALAPTLLIYDSQSGQYVDRTIEAGLSDPLVAKSVVAGDFDNDMDIDIYVSSSISRKALPSTFYQNQGDGTFIIVPNAAGADLNPVGIHSLDFNAGLSLSVADYDVDGFLDLYVGSSSTRPVAGGSLSLGSPPHLFHNIGNSNHWLEIDLQGVISNRDGIGAKVLATAGGMTQVRDQNGGMHRFGQNQQRLHFGLGNHSKVDQLEIHWPSGIVQTLENVTSNQVLRVVEPGTPVGDLVIEGTAGNDAFLQGRGGNDLIRGLKGDDNLFGHEGNDSLEGGQGNDYLSGGAGSNHFKGESGNDTYEVGSLTDVLIENSNEGIDTVKSSINWILAANFENLALTGTTIKGVGNSLNNLITGNSADNLLVGAEGDDTLDGGLGDDTLEGGKGNDVYWVNSPTNQIIEHPDAGNQDQVQSSVSWDLQAHLENLRLTGAAIEGTGNALNNLIIGNAANNLLVAKEGNDRLEGNQGSDTLVGGLGNDTYVLDGYSDIIIENADEGIDRILVSVSWTLDRQIENLTLTGTNAIDGRGDSRNNFLQGNQADNSLWGNDGNDTLVGQAGDDTLIGQKGDDVLIGNQGSDRLRGSKGSDRFVYLAWSDRGDTITNFDRNNDIIDLSAMFNALGYEGAKYLSDGYLRLVPSQTSIKVQIDIDRSGEAGFDTLMTLNESNITSISQINWIV